MSRPAYRITANGADLESFLATRLKGISVTDTAGFESDVLEIELSDHDGAAPIALPSTGAELEVWLGYRPAGLRRMGLFVVDEIELAGWPGCMTIRGRAAPFEATARGKTDLQTQKTRA